MPEEKVFKKNIEELLQRFEMPRRQALSLRYPKLKGAIISSRIIARKAWNFFDWRITRKRKIVFYPSIITRHQSLLQRRLGDSDPRLQKQKIINLKIAASKLNGLIIMPGKIFSFWEAIGEPKISKGYVNGMLLSNGKIIEGLGGGLCQMSNLLYWLLLHSPCKIIERYHHSMDVFPDESRVLPFGSGATILYNFIDLKAKNISREPLQLKIWLTDRHLKGQILSIKPLGYKYHLFETNHYFIKNKKKYFRYNEILRKKIVNGLETATEKITRNFAPVLYQVKDDYIKKNKYKVLNVK